MVDEYMAGISESQNRKLGTQVEYGEDADLPQIPFLSQFL